MNDVQAFDTLLTLQAKVRRLEIDLATRDKRYAQLSAEHEELKQKYAPFADTERGIGAYIDGLRRERDDALIRASHASLFRPSMNQNPPPEAPLSLQRAVAQHPLMNKNIPQEARDALAQLEHESVRRAQAPIPRHISAAEYASSGPEANASTCGSRKLSPVEEAFEVQRREITRLVEDMHKLRARLEPVLASAKPVNGKDCAPTGRPEMQTLLEVQIADSTQLVRQALDIAADIHARLRL